MCDPVESDDLKYYTCLRNCFLKSVNLSRHVKKLIPTEKNPDCSTRLLQRKKEYIENLLTKFD